MKKLEVKKIEYIKTCCYWTKHDYITELPVSGSIPFLVHHNSDFIDLQKLYEDIYKLNVENYYCNAHNRIYYRINNQSNFYVSEFALEKLLIISRYIKIKKIKKILKNEET